jgi:peptidyl-prolyl cis-trans isomerase SurA
VASVKAMKKGEISEPLRSGSGLHILFLKDTKGGFETQKVIQTHARHILIKTNEIMDEQASFDKITLLRQRIEKGEDFAELAVQFSDDKGSGALGGDLKWSDPGAFVPEFTKAMNDLDINQMSQPVKTQFGWHIIQVLERREKDQTEDNKRKKAYQILHNRKFEEEAQVWVRELKDQTYIKIVDDK